MQDTVILNARRYLSPLLAADTLEKVKKCKNPDLNATKECVQAGMIAANLKQDYGAAEGLFSLACAKGDGEGCFYLGELYKNNLAKAADKSERETKISAYYKASCVLYEYLPGCLALANFVQEELGDEVQSFAINNTLCNKKIRSRMLQRGLDDRANGRRYRRDDGVLRALV